MIKCTPAPISIPYSILIKRQHKKVIKNGTSSDSVIIIIVTLELFIEWNKKRCHIHIILLLIQRCLIISNSIKKITEVMITAAKTAFGMYAKEGIKKYKANRTKIPRKI